MQNYKKILTFALVLSLMSSVGVSAAYADDAAEEDTSAETAAEEDTGDEEAEDEEPADELEPAITDEQMLAKCEKAFENDKFITWYYTAEDDKKAEPNICLQVKSSGKCWWVSPINAKADPTPIDEKGSTMKKGQIEQTQSSVAINVGDLRQEKRTELPAPAYSSKATIKISTDSTGIVAEYNYSSNGVKLKTHYDLTDRGLHVYVKTSEIEEKDSESDEGKVLTKLILCPYMGAVSATDPLTGTPNEGYMIVPDGSGAVINYNNGKTNYASYQQRVYGMDYTAVPLNAPRVTEQAYLPVMATVQGNQGLVMVATEGEANVYTNAQISGQNKQAFNNCYFMFETRSSDEFFMSGTDSNKITVFEKYGIKTEQFGVEYIPIESDTDINYADCAQAYRDYLESTKGFKAKSQPNTSNFYMDTYGSVMKEESIVGIPVTVKKKLTTFSQARSIASELQNAGAESIVMNYNDWTKESVKNVVATSAKALGKLGKTNELTNMNSDNLTVYASLNNFTMEKGRAGYGMLSNTAIRVSSAYSRQSKYSPAFGVAISGVSPALIAPNTYPKIFSETLSSFKSANIANIGYGDWSTKLVSDFSRKNGSSRDATMKTLMDGYSQANSEGEKIIAAGANSYILPYVEAVTDVPVYSSAFNITDEDIPFYQMVLHGYMPFSTKAINASSDTDMTFIRALAAGSDVNYDFIYESADELLDTEDNDLYYSHYSGWVEQAGNQARIVKKVLGPVSDYTISDYTVDGDIIRTTYSKLNAADEVIEVDTANLTVTAKGETIDLVAEGAIEEGGA